MLGNMTSDEELMMQYQAGSTVAFDTLYEKYRGDVYRFLLRQFDTATAEELYQDVWMKLIQARDRYQPTARFRTWLYTITHNHIKDHYRKHRVTAVADDNDCIDTRAPERIAQDQQILAVLHAGIRRLPDVQREAFLLKEESGLSLDEIAKVMGASKESTKSRLRYAAARLREQLKGLWP
jgi:RNA polymerase sigma-70 factor (ECF subfamily)